MHGVRSEKDALDRGTAERLSRRLRMARRRRGMTLKALADAAGCSESLLSKIENGKAYPSLPMLNRLARALESGIGWLFEEDEAERTVSRAAGHRAPAGDASIGAARQALRYEILHVEAGDTSLGTHEHAGEEVGYLLDGHLELVIDGRVHALKAGDTFGFRSEQPHSFRNVGSRRASVFRVNAAPSA